VSDHARQAAQRERAEADAEHEALRSYPPLPSNRAEELRLGLELLRRLENEVAEELRQLEEGEQ
jgi:hypothetical protein